MADAYAEAELALRLLGNSTLDELQAVIDRLEAKISELQADLDRVIDARDSAEEKLAKIESKIDDLYRLV